MGFPRELTSSLARYIIGNKLKGNKHFPLVLMLEPTFRCNLACAGCGRIREYRDVADRMLSVRECLDAMDEAGAPVVSITGGEPLLHPEIGEIVAGAIQKKRAVHLCTNGLLLEKSLEKFTPGPYMSFVLHLDSLAETHDRFAGRPGVFDTAISAMNAAHRKGFRVLVNTTVYRTTDLEEVRRLFQLLNTIPVDGIMMAPAFGYQGIDGNAVLSRSEAVAVFERIFGMRREFLFYNTPLYLEFLAGKYRLDCTPWSTPTRNPKGWKKPCYLITDGHCNSFRELMQETRWEDYGAGHDPRCANCMVHCGFEASAIDAVFHSPPALWRTLRWHFQKTN